MHLLSTVILSPSHIIAHCVIFFAYLVACLRVPPGFQAIIRLRWETLLSGAGFFLLCGITHLELALGNADGTFVTITDHLQAVSIVAFLILLNMDLLRATRRLRAAFAVIREQTGKDGERVIATIIEALQGK